VDIRHTPFRLSWLAVYSVMVVIISIIGALLMTFVILDNGNFFLLFILMFEFGLTIIMFAFIMTTLFSKAKVSPKMLCK
jgi:ATP-binding cassette subfamily A (ABC1) protein 5